MPIIRITSIMLISKWKSIKLSIFYIRYNHPDYSNLLSSIYRNCTKYCNTCNCLSRKLILSSCIHACNLKFMATNGYNGWRKLCYSFNICLHLKMDYKAFTLYVIIDYIDRSLCFWSFCLHVLVYS